jgi:hypothetical protein
LRKRWGAIDCKKEVSRLTLDLIERWELIREMKSGKSR